MSAPQQPQTAPSLRAAYAVGCAIVIAGLASTFAGLPMFRFGIWYQSEPIFFVNMLTATGMMAILIWLTAIGQPIGQSLRHPAMLCFTGFLLWSALTSLLSDIPMRSMFGIPETAEGTLWYLSIWVAAVLAYAVLRHGRYARTLFWGQWGVLLFTIAAQIGVSDAIKVFKWGDYLGLIAIYYSISLIYAFRLFPEPRFRWVLMFPAPIALYVSQNHAALLFAGLFFGIAAIWWVTRHYGVVRRYGKYLLLVSLLVPLAGPIASLNATLSCNAVNGISALFYSAPPACLNSREFNDNTLGTRLLFNRVSFDILREQPRFLLTGNGYGSYADLFYRHSFVDGITIYDADSRLRPNWKYAQGHVFHPHNSWVYMLISTGIPGLLLWIGTFILLFWRLHGPPLILAGCGWMAALGLLSTWFSVPMVAPFMAVAMASSLHLRPPPADIQPPSVRPALSLTACVCLFMVCAVAALIIRDVGVRSEQRMRTVLFGTPNVEYTAITDYGRGHMHQWWLAISYSDYLMRKRRDARPYTQRDIFWADVMLKLMAHAQAHPPYSSRIDGYYAGFLNDIMLLYGPTTRLWAPLVHAYMEQWPDAIRNAMRAVPKRYDIATPFFEFWLDQYRVTEAAAKKQAKQILMETTDDMLAHTPNHMIALWYRGRVLALASDTNAQGLALMRQALAMGVKGFVPVPPALRETLKNLM
jgi:hypothetical protein